MVLITQVDYGTEVWHRRHKILAHPNADVNDLRQLFAVIPQGPMSSCSTLSCFPKWNDRQS